MLKNRGIAVVSRRVGIPARRDRSFILGAKGRGFSFLDFERNKDRALFYERKRKFIFLLSAKGSENDKGGIFRKPQNSSHPHKRKAGEKRTFAPLSKGAKNESLASGQMRQRRAHTIRHDRVGKRSSSYAIKARGGEPLRACVNYAVCRRCQGREKFRRFCPRNFSTLFLDKSDV